MKSIFLPIILILTTFRSVITVQNDYDDNVENSEDYYYDPCPINEPQTESSSSEFSIKNYLEMLNDPDRKRIPVVKHVSNLNETMSILEQVMEMFGRWILEKFDRNQFMGLIESAYGLNITDPCFVSLAKLAGGIFNLEIWALKFVDAFGRIPTGITEGSISHFGEFDQCIEIDHRDTDIQGRYCLAKLILPYPDLSKPGNSYFSGIHQRPSYRYLMNFLKLYNLDNYLTAAKLAETLNNQRGVTFRLGTCFPAACSPEELESLLNHFLYPLLRMPIELQPDCYDSTSSRPYDVYERIAMAVIIAILTVNVLCTCWHMSGHSRHRFRWSRCFSIIRNARALFDTTERRIGNGSGGEKTDPGQRFKCIDAIRLLLVINVCIDHMILFTPFMSFMVFKRILNSVITRVYYFNKYFFARNILIVDALFIISGLLLSYSLSRKLSLTGGRIQYWLFTVRLWLKYSVPMFFVVQLFWLLPRTGNGPIWNLGMSLLVDTCKEPESLLSSFLYWSNYRIKPKKNVFNFDLRFVLCNPPTWFLSALFQLQLIGPIFVLALHRYGRFGLAINLAMILIGCYASISPDLLFGQRSYLDSPTISSLEELTKSFVAFHMGINQYVISFFIGIILGYLIHQQLLLANNYHIISSRYRAITWIMAMSGLTGVMYWFNTLHQVNVAPVRISILLWFSIGKLIGCTAIGWVLYELCTGEARFMEKFFSLALFRFLSRLSFGIYLLHFLPLSYRLFTVRDTYVMTDRLFFEFILVDFFQTSVLAVLFYVMVERPFNNLIAMMFARLEARPDPVNPSVIDGQSNTVSSSCQKTINNANNAGTIEPATSSSTIATIRIEIQDATSLLSLPQINLYAANCGDFLQNHRRLGGSRGRRRNSRLR